MKATLRGTTTLLAILALAHGAVGEAPSVDRAWSFESDKADSPPAGFSFSKSDAGKPGRWIVKAEPAAPSARHVLAQLDGDDTDDRFLMAVADTPKLRDLKLSVRCKAVTGKVDQACGLVFRYRDAKNYYVTRSNSLEGNVRFYFVKDGRRKQLASWSGEVTANAWHELRAQAQGEHFQIFWNGAKVIDVHDATLQDAGKVGLWTKADSVTYFDDFKVSSIGVP